MLMIGGRRVRADRARRGAPRRPRDKRRAAAARRARRARAHGQGPGKRREQLLAELERLWESSRVAGGIDRVADRRRSPSATAASARSRGVSLELPRGSMCALLGHNGAGKTTLLGILSTLVRPSDGTRRATARGGAAIDGEEVRREIGMLAHASLCYGELTARENLELFAGLYDVDGSAAAIDAMLDRVGLEPRARDRAARTYSRGMLQRLALARALLTKPSLLLLDEPFTGLDRGGALALGAQLGELRDERRDRRRRDARPRGDRRPHRSRRDPAPRPARVRGARTRTTTSSSKTSTIGTRTEMSLLRQAARVAWKDLRDRAAQQGDRLHDGVLRRRCSSSIYSFAFPRDVRPRARRGARACCGSRSRSPARSASAARSIASARTTRCARCCSRRSRGSRCSSARRSRSPCWCSPSPRSCTPLLALFLDAPLFAYPLPLVAASLVLGAIGFAIVGSVFAATLLKVALARRAAAGDPLSDPRSRCSSRVRTTTEALLAESPNLDAAWYWIGFLGIYDAAFLVLSLWIFESLVIE